MILQNYTLKIVRFKSFTLSKRERFKIDFANKIYNACLKQNYSIPLIF